MSAHRSMVILVVGLSERLLRHAPRLREFAEIGGMRRLRPVLPAVTTTVQASMLTGRPPAQHGVVGNGWYDRRLAEVQFWKQSNHLVEGEKVWHEARRRDPSFTCAKLFWWYNMYAEVDLSVTPRPIYKADGRKIPDVYTEPPDLRATLQDALGTFPLFHFWGPTASIRSTRWIADAALHVERTAAPTLSLVYLPHLDYPLQRLGPDHPDVPQAVAEVDAEAGRLIDVASERNVRPIVLSEYAIEAVSTPVHLNRTLREAGLLRVRDEEGLELLDAGASRAFAVADHQIAHIYVRDASDRATVRDLLASEDGVDTVLDEAERRTHDIDHARSGDLVAVAERGCWFTYYYWLDDARAPDFARTVDIHRKPGYDPVELFFDPTKSAVKVRAAGKLLAKKLGFRTLLDLIPLDAALVRGSHGRVPEDDEDGPILLSSLEELLPEAATLPCTAVHDLLLAHLFSSSRSPSA